MRRYRRPPFGFFPSSSVQRTRIPPPFLFISPTFLVQKSHQGGFEHDNTIRDGFRLRQCWRTPASAAASLPARPAATHLWTPSFREGRRSCWCFPTVCTVQTQYRTRRQHQTALRNDRVQVLGERYDRVCFLSSFIVSILFST